MEFLFYECLGKGSLERTLFSLLERSLERGWRSFVCFSSSEEVERMDDALWMIREGSFLPHGIEDAAAADHPILLSTKRDSFLNREVYFSVGSVDFPAEVGTLPGCQRCVRIFEKEKLGDVVQARSSYQDLISCGMFPEYWEQDSLGSWKKGNL